MNDTRWTTVSGGVAAGCPTTATCRRACSSTPAVPHQLPRRHQRGDDAATSSVSRPISTCRPTASAAWRSGRRSLGNVERVQRGLRLALGRRRQPGGCLRRGGADVDHSAVTKAAIAGAAAGLRGQQQSGGAFVQDIFTPMPQLTITLSARVDHWRNYDGHNLETTVIPGTPTPTTSRASRSHDTRRQPARGRAVSRDRSRQRLGRRERRIPRADAQRAVPPVPVGAVMTRPNDQLGPERLVGGEAGVNVAGREERDVADDVVDNRVKNPVANVTIASTPTQTTQQRRTWAAPKSAACRPTSSTASARLARRGRLPVQRRESDRRRRGERRARRQVPAAGAEEPRYAAGGVCEPEVPQRRGRHAVRRPAVRRRSERQASAGGAGRGRVLDDASARACRATRPWTSRRRARSAATSRCSSACRTCSTGILRADAADTIGTPRLVNGGVRMRFGGTVDVAARHRTLGLRRARRVARPRRVAERPVASRLRRRRPRPAGSARSPSSRRGGRSRPCSTARTTSASRTRGGCRRPCSVSSGTPG